MTNIKVGTAADFPEGKIVPIEVNGQKLILVRVDGAVHAMARKCTHLGADLCGGKVADGAVICPKHGTAFAVSTGQPVMPAKILFLKMTPKPLATYAVVIDEDDVLVSVA